MNSFQKYLNKRLLGKGIEWPDEMNGVYFWFTLIHILIHFIEQISWYLLVVFEEL
jgi:hypothetical protein